MWVWWNRDNNSWFWTHHRWIWKTIFFREYSPSDPKREFSPRVQWNQLQDQICQLLFLQQAEKKKELENKETAGNLEQTRYPTTPAQVYPPCSQSKRHAHNKLCYWVRYCVSWPLDNIHHQCNMESTHQSLICQLSWQKALILYLLTPKKNWAITPLIYTLCTFPVVWFSREKSGN